MRERERKRGCGEEFLGTCLGFGLVLSKGNRPLLHSSIFSVVFFSYFFYAATVSFFTDGGEGPK